VISYRRRIGVFAMCMRPRGSRACFGEYHAESKWDAWTDISARLMICTFFLAALWGSGMCGQMILSSNCVRGIADAMMGSDVFSHPIEYAEASSSSSFVYEVDRVELLILCGDIELNPGPVGREEMEEIAASIVERLSKKMDQMTVEIKSVQHDIGKLSEKLLKIERDVGAIQRQVDEQEVAIDLVADGQKTTDRLVKELADCLEDREIRDRRDNLLLHGVPEAGTDDREDCEARFVEIVNDVLPNHLQVSDIVRAHRVGKRAPGKTRPLIARVARSTLKYTILQKRKELRERGIGVSGDLTQKQRQAIQRARSEGLFAYYKAGVLHTEARRPQADVGDGRPVTRSYARALSETDSTR